MELRACAAVAEDMFTKLLCSLAVARRSEQFRAACPRASHNFPQLTHRARRPHVKVKASKLTSKRLRNQSQMRNIRSVRKYSKRRSCLGIELGATTTKAAGGRAGADHARCHACKSPSVHTERATCSFLTAWALR